MKNTLTTFFRMASVTFVAMCLFLGCSSPYNWSDDVGHYTKTQAIKEFGPPDLTGTDQYGITLLTWNIIVRDPFPPHRRFRVARRLQFDTNGKLMHGSYKRNMYSIDGKAVSYPELIKDLR